MVCPILVPGIGGVERTVTTACDVVAITWYNEKINARYLSVIDCGHQVVNRYIMYNAYEKMKDATT